MSVVNQMLKELQDNERPVSLDNEFQLAEIKQRAVYSWLLWAILVVVIGGVIYYLVSDYSNSDQSISDTSFSYSAVQSSPIQTSDSSAQKIESGQHLKSQQNKIIINEATSGNPLSVKPDRTQKSLVLTNVENNTDLASDSLLSESSTFTATPNIIETANNTDMIGQNSVASGQKENVDRASAADAGKAKLSNVDVQPGNETQAVKTLSLKTRLRQTLESIKHDEGHQDIDGIVKRYQALIQQAPDFHSARIALSDFYRQYLPNQYQPLLIEAVNRYPSVEAYRLRLTKLLVAAGDFKQASQYLNIENLSFDLRQLRALVYQRIGQQEKAINDYKQLILATPDDGRLFLAMGISLKQLGYNREARLSFIKANRDQRLSKKQKTYLKQQINLLRNS